MFELHCVTLADLAGDRIKRAVTLLDDAKNKKIVSWQQQITSSRILVLALCLSLLIKTASGGGACISPPICDGNSFVTNCVTTSGGSTIATTTLAATLTTAYLDPVATKGPLYPRGYYSCLPSFTNCITGVAPLDSAYTVSISPATC